MHQAIINRQVNCSSYIFILLIMDQEILYFEPTTTIREDLSNLPYVRFYMQEDIFVSQEIETGKIQLPFNQYVHQIVNSLTLMNKVIANNSKTTTSFLDNGKDIYLKKKTLFIDFLEQYPVINEALQCLQPFVRATFINSVMALSNLILKLSINMAKISIVLVNKFVLPSYLNLFTVSIIFQKYLEYKLLLKRQGLNTLQQYKSFIKQYPKISIVRLQKVRNPFDIQYIQKCQDLFLPDTFKNEHKHNLQAQIIQYIQFFEEDLEGIYEKSEKYKKFGKYEAFDLKRQFGLKSPFSFELYLLINEVLLSKMIEFKPDIIIYIQDYDNSYKVMDCRVRGMILNDFSAKVQNKIYVFKQFGINTQLKMQKLRLKTGVLNYKQQRQIPLQFQQLINNKNIQQQSSKYHHAIINSKQQNINFLKQSISKKLKQTNYINVQLNNDIKLYFKKLYLHLKQLPIDNQGLIQSTLGQMHKLLLEDLTYLSLALIQKSNFDEPVHQYRNYMFKKDFLEKMIAWMTEQKEKIKNERPYAQPVQLLKNKIEKVKGILQMTIFKQKRISSKGVQVNPDNVFKIFNLKSNKIEQLKDYNGRSIQLDRQDTSIVIYCQNAILLVIFRDDCYEIYRRLMNESNYKKVKEQGFTNGGNYGLKRKHSTLVYNNKYLYKAFGQFVNEQNTQSAIYRFKIQNPLDVQKQKWQSLGSCYDSQEQKTLGTKIKIQLKKHGYGFSYDIQEGNKKINMIIFGGGYNYQVQNQQKVNRYFYLIKDNLKEIRKVGKTCPELINQSQNLKVKNVIYPFIYGIPIKLNISNSNEIALINFNGYHENVNHFKKIFLTKIKCASLHQSPKVGIIAQNKMIYRERCPQADLANKNMVLSCLMNSYNKINRFEDRAVIYDDQNKPILIERIKVSVQEGDIITLNNLQGHSEMMEEENQNIELYFGKKRLLV